MSETQSMLERLRSEYLESPERRQAQRQLRGETNIGGRERWVSIASGSLLTLLGARRRGLSGLMITALGGGLLYRGATGYCAVYKSLGIDTAHDKMAADRIQRGIRVVQSFSINKSPQELYQFWRNFKNLPSFMTHLQSVEILDDRLSHWVAKAPGIVGGKVEWDAEVTADEPNSLIAWRSLPGADIDHGGSIRFVDRGDHGTIVTATLQYVAPAGRLGKWLAKLTGEEPEQQVREDLRRFKRLMETGEIVTVEGQPRGSCMSNRKETSV